MKTRTSFGQHTLPGEYFTSQEIFREEQEKIFGRHWLLAGHISQLPEAGSFFLFEIGRESVIVMRDATGKVGAHHNFCRHRGTRLCTEAHGKAAHALQCSYHAWTYGFDGALRSAPNMQDVPGFDKANYGLKPAGLAEWRGFLFVNLAEEPVPLEQ